MTRWSYAAARVLLLVYMALLPWRVYTFVPLAPEPQPWAGSGSGGFVPWVTVPLGMLISLALVVLAVCDVVASKRLRVPFEFLWPVVAFVVLNALPSAWRLILTSLGGRGFVSSEMMGLTLLGYCMISPLPFAAAMHFTRSRRDTLTLLWTLMLSAACMGAFNLAAPALDVLPMGYSLDSSAVVYFERDLRLAAYLLTYLTALSAGLFFSRGMGARARMVAGVCLAVLACAWIGAAPAGLAEMIAKGRLYPLGRMPLHTASLVLVLWIRARTIAAVALDERRTPGPTRWGLLAVIVIPIMLDVAEGWTHDLSIRSILLAVLAAYAMPATPETSPDQPRRRWYWLALAPCVLFVMLNIVHVNPYIGFCDTRNYATAAARLVPRPDVSGQTVSYPDSSKDGLLMRNQARAMRHQARALRHTEFWADRYPEERQVHLWLAYAELTMEHPYGAADEFARSVRPPKEGVRQILPPPSVDQRKEFLVALRDHCSALEKPETCFAYEWALIASGQRAQARTLLELRRPEAPEGDPRIGDDDRDALHMTVVSLLRLEDGEDFLEDWSAAELLGLLRNWGATVEPMPDGLEGAYLPLVCCAHFSGKTGRLFACADGTSGWAEWPHPGSLLDEDVAILSRHPECALSPPTLNDEGLWQVVLAWPEDDESAYIHLTCEMQGTSFRATTGLPPGGRGFEIDTTADPVALPGAPAIQIWVTDE